ncbi:hypothetical protein CMUS01_08463 [Colletotrichum musicola]|uniref:Uncharacterized protein n=1 Tax=Colletotrichum musicola TaxID=2175873 RepID=A0A8H6NDL3_9PEZI|nr:hypothetical protein CMUS01_08463 [Colletotrichum musicola]
MPGMYKHPPGEGPDSVDSSHSYDAKAIAGTERTFSVVADAGLGPVFPQLLFAALVDRVAGHLEICASSGTTADSEDGFLVRQSSNGDGLVICGPAAVIGYEGPVRGLSLQHDDKEELATASAVALSHLGRFRHVLTLPSAALGGDKPFVFLFQNSITDKVLYLTVISLGSAFDIVQLYPPTDGAVAVETGKSIRFSMIGVPNELRLAAGRTSHRDIIRTIVTSEPYKWKSLELPEIWDSRRVRPSNDSPPDRRAERSDGGATWWMEDQVMFTASE